MLFVLNYLSPLIRTGCWGGDTCLGALVVCFGGVCYNLGRSPVEGEAFGSKPPWNPMPLNLMCMGFPGALSAPSQSTGSLPSCIEQSGSRAPWRPDTKHTQAANSLAELLCSVYILSHRNRTVEVRQMYNLQRFWNTTLLLYERTYSFKQNFV